MKLLTDELREKMKHGKKAPKGEAWVKFFCPWSNWTWYATDGKPYGDDFLFFGYVEGLENEWGSFSLNELESIEGPLGLKIERDLYYNGKLPEGAIL